MSVPPVSTIPTTTTASATASSKVDYNAFLKLLTAQMRNQDPTDPADATQWVSQFAQFSQVEQALQTNSKLDSLLSSMALTQAGGLIGQRLTSADGLTTGIVQAIRITSAGGVAELVGGRDVVLGPGVSVGT